MTTAARSSDPFGAWPALPPCMAQAELDAFLLQAARHDATDLHVQSGRPLVAVPPLRLAGLGFAGQLVGFGVDHLPLAAAPLQTL